MPAIQKKCLSDEAVKAICETGRTIWRHKNEEKFNDYVIYDTPSGKQEQENILQEIG